MRIAYIQDMEFVDNELHNQWLKTLKYQKYNSFNFEMNKWEEEPLFIRTDKVDNNERPIYLCNFVGIIWYRNTLILALPKAVETSENFRGVDDSKWLFTYADLLDKYFEKVRATAHVIKNFEPIYPWCIPELRKWCEKMVQSDAVLPVPQVIAAVKFEKVFEWMLGILFDNHISLNGTQVMFQSQILNQTAIDINAPQYNTYAWEAISKRNSDSNRVEKREAIFSDQQMKNIPDIVTEVCLELPEEKKCCCIIDAKYSGWNKAKNCYKLPRNMDIYKQFFYQEQFLRIYESFEEQNVCVYNFLVLPDYMMDTGKNVLRQCAFIPFAYHPEQSIAVLQVNMDALIDICAHNNQELMDKKDREMRYMLTTYKRIIPMKSRELA